MSVVIEVETVEIVVENETVLNPIVIEVGDPYIPGSSGSSLQTHTQSTPAATWTIPNQPGAKARVLAIYDDTGRAGFAGVTVTDANTTITFSQPRTGSVDYLRG